MNGEMASRRAAVAVAALLVCGGVAAADVILLRDGSQKRGALSACDQNSCRIGAESVNRTNIEWIGLDRDAPAPTVRNPERDELHLANNAVQSVTLTGVDAGFVHATLGGQGFSAASSLPRRSVAWIHLGRPRQGATGPVSNEPTPSTKEPIKEPVKELVKDKDKEQRTKNRAARADGAPWRLPSRIYEWKPPDCPTCDASLAVLELRVEGEVVRLVKSRVIQVGPTRLSATWLTFNPPVPLFPSTTDVDRLVFKGGGSANVTLDHYLEGHSGPRSAGGGTPTSAVSPNIPCVPVSQSGVHGPPTPTSNPNCTPGTGPIPYSTEREDDPLARAIGQSAGIPQEWASRLADAWRDRLARDAAAQGTSGGHGTGDYRQHTIERGQVEYRLEFNVINWPIIAGEITRGGARFEASEKLKKIPVYDVQARMDLAWSNVSGQSRRVDHRSYTKDDSWQRGPGGPAPGPRQYAPAPEATPYAPDTPEHQGSGVAELLGDPLKTLSDALDEPLTQLGEAATRMRDEALSGVSGGTSAPNTQLMAGSLYAVWLGMRWSRSEGRVSAHHGTDIFSYIEGRPEPVPWIVSGTRPQHAFDMAGAPPWTAPNPEPPPRPANSGGSWFRP